MDNYVPLSSYMMPEREHDSFKERILQMELAADEQHTRVGQTNMLKMSWTQLEFENEDRVREYLMEDVYPHLPYQLRHWLRYIENFRMLCARAMEIIGLPARRRKQGY